MNANSASNGASCCPGSACGPAPAVAVAEAPAAACTPATCSTGGCGDGTIKVLKPHLALSTRHFDKAVAFYRTFFNVAPVKLYPGYAKFDLASPALNLTLNATTDATPRGTLNHLGIQVASARDVADAIALVKAAGLDHEIEENVTCCYAVQSKVWVRDPDGNAWEVFHLEVADTGPEGSACATTAADGPSCVPNRG